MPALPFGLGEKKETITGNDIGDPEKSPAFGGNGYYDGFSPEDGGRKASGPRKMSRIDAPRTRSITGLEGTSDDASDPSTSVAKQMELESGNEIQYRTCSWQKVRFSP